VNDESEFVFQHDWGFTNEDCLRLNIWSPGLMTAGVSTAKKRPAGGRPVMVWLHGGGYSAGSSQELPSYDGENLSRTGDVVLVSVNHRLNILGFLDLAGFGDKYKASANVGMMDLVAALQWVQANIANFGGDPSNVTIFGQSGGGGKVMTLMNTPSAKGLFHKAIVQSGGALQFSERDMTHRVGQAVLAELGLQASQIDSIQTVPYQKLAAAGTRALQKVRQQLAAEGKPVTGFGLGWAPSRNGTFLPYQPTQAEALAISSGVPLLVGSTKNEFMPSLSSNLRDATPEQAKDQLQKRFGDKTDAYIAAAKKTYPQDTKASDLMDIDDRFRSGTIKMANLKSAHSTAPVYVYLFTWQSPVLDGAYKAVHCMEIPFVFNNIARCEEMTGGGKEAYELARKMSQSWVSFARSGNPNYKELPAWQPYTETSGTTMLFDNQSVIKTHPDKEIQALATASSTRLP
jgi:para-nitrobenzyl esterase